MHLWTIDEDFWSAAAHQPHIWSLRSCWWHQKFLTKAIANGSAFFFFSLFFMVTVAENSKNFGFVWWKRPRKKTKTRPGAWNYSSFNNRLNMHESIIVPFNASKFIKFSQIFPLPSPKGNLKFADARKIFSENYHIFPPF